MSIESRDIAQRLARLHVLLDAAECAGAEIAEYPEACLDGG